MNDPDFCSEFRVSLTTSDTHSTVRIQDNGTGLPPDRSRLFEPYVTTREKGTGLGLPIVKKIIEEHFGQIAFADAPGGGSNVRMSFEPEALAQLAGTPGRAREDISGMG